MKKYGKLFVSVLLCLAICASMFCVTAFAADDKTSVKDTVKTELSENALQLKTLLKKPLYVKKTKDAGLTNKVNVSLDVTLGTATLYLPGQADASKLKLCWDTKGLVLAKGDKTYESGDAPVAAAGKSIKYKVKKGNAAATLTIKTMKGSSGVEPMYLEIDETKGLIETMNLDSDHEKFCYGKVKLGDTNKYMSIKGRGNSTWDMPKKPYNMTIYKDSNYDDKKKAELIDGVKSKKWSLIANYFDTTLMRNTIAQDLACNLGIGLETKYVDLWMNGDYLGNYLLLPKKDYNCSDDGYILENDHIPDSSNETQFKFPYMHNMPAKHNVLNVDDIGKNAEANGVTYKTVQEDFTKAWKTVLDYDSEEYQKYFDIDSFAKMYLMFEVSKTYDCYAGNILMHRDGFTSKDKIIAGPAWDYDVAFGRTLHKFLVGTSEPLQMNAEGWFNDGIGYLASGEQPVQMLQEFGKHESFMIRVAQIYTEYKWAFDYLDKDITVQTNLIRDSALMNNNKFLNSLSAEYVVAPNTMSMLGSGKYKLNYMITTDWDSFVYNLHEYCQKRVMWMTDHLYIGDDGITITTYHGGTVEVPATK